MSDIHTTRDSERRSVEEKANKAKSMLSARNPDPIINYINHIQKILNIFDNKFSKQIDKEKNQKQSGNSLSEVKTNSDINSNMLPTQAANSLSKNENDQEKSF